MTDTKDLFYKTVIIVSDLPKKHKYSIGDFMLKSASGAMTCLKVALDCKEVRTEYLAQFREQFSAWTLWIQTCHHFELLGRNKEENDREYIEISLKVEAISRQQHAWFKSLSSSESL